MTQLYFFYTKNLDNNKIHIYLVNNFVKKQDIIFQTKVQIIMKNIKHIKKLNIH